MTDKPNLSQLSKEIYEANKLKGWHEQEYSNEHYLCLVIGELMEAVEADRKGMRADYAEWQQYINDSEKSYVDMNIAFEFCIKDSIEDELAAAVIRLLDLAGVRGIYIQNCSESFREKFFNKLDGLLKELPFTDKIYSLVQLAAFDGSHIVEKIEQIITSIEWLCDNLSIDLWLHVSLKLKYNPTL